MLKRIVCFALLLIYLGVAPAHPRDSYPRQAAVDAVHYRIGIEIKDGTDEISADTEILFAFSDDGVRTITLDFGGLAIDRVSEDGHPIKFTRADGKLSIALEGQHRRGDRCWVAIRYHGRPTDGLLIKKNKFGDSTVFADNWPDRAHHWFPSVDHPYDKATVEFLVTAPEHYDVIGNGALLETTSNQNGTRLTHWSESVPIPTYCMVIGATAFAIIHAGSWNGIPVLYYLYPKDRDRGMKDYGRVLQMIEFYTNLVGPFPYEKLALVESTTKFGGMENSSNIFFDEKAFNGTNRLENTVAHEIAHQWFGDSVTEADWHHLWLSEGFATYFGHLFFEHTDGRDKFLSLMRADKERYLGTYRADPQPIYDPRITNLLSLLNPNNYEKGGWMLHMLRHITGDKAFFQGIREYFRTYRDRNALTPDFQRVMEFHAGRPLDWFFNEWFLEPGYPIYEASWQWDESGKELRLRVSQKQQKPVFRMPLDLELRLGDGTRSEVLEVKERDQSFTFKLEARPRNVTIDPGEWVLKVLNLTEGKDGVSPPAVK